MAKRILTTHVGSLPRPPELFELLLAAEGGTADAAKLREATSAAIVAAVKDQADAGVDVIGDGEMGKVSYTHYVRHRLGGVEPATPDPSRPPLVPADRSEEHTSELQSH